MSSQLIRSGECRKFSPNIFNKTKCTNCFRQKEEHSAEALESNRCTRKIAKCGYLFVAPGWDFTNPINRTKRWQRRWFVLYDDGELSYSLDEHPETVPQASIDMNKVIEVAAADDITGNPFSLAITAPDVVHFVKGTSREEARFWSDVLSVFPRSKGRHKRNATFPGSQPSTKSNHILQTPPVRGYTGTTGPASEAARNQYNSRISTPVWEGDDVFPTKEVGNNAKSPPPSAAVVVPPPATAVVETISPTSISPCSESRKVYSTSDYIGSPPTRDKLDEKCRSRRMVNREKRGLKSGRSFSEDIAKMVPSWQEKPQNQSHPDVSHRLLLEEYESECKLKDIADSLTRPRTRPLPNSQHCIEPTRDGDLTSHKQVRGDPDGCGLDPNAMRYSPSDLRVDLPAEELLNIKRGWLMKQGQDKEWTKHWFVLRGNGLLYYRDPKAEDQGILDGVIDLSSVSAVSEMQVQRNYGFQLIGWDGRQFVLSALTGGIRANWMTALKKAAGVQDSIEISSPVQDRESLVSSTPISSRSLLFSSDDEYRTASESGRRESGEWGEALPPSPPLNRTPMSKVKERARGVSKWRGLGSKRSRSSPPNSRRSTLDSVSSQEIIAACTQTSPTKLKDLDEDIVDYSGLYKDKSTSQKDLRKCRTPDVAALERKVEDLMKNQEETGKLRAKDSAEIETLRSRYVEDKHKWERALQSVEVELEDANARCMNLCAELSERKELEDKLRDELSRLEMRLACAIEENEALYRRVKELEKPTSLVMMRDRARSVDSLSDLTNIDLDLDFEQLDKDRIADEYTDLRVRFEKAVNEIRALKRELRESQAAADWLELSVVSSRQESKALKEESDAGSKLMAARIQDLATKLSSSEKQIRLLKQKLSKTETREKRRSLSLKGRESFTLCKELEDKLFELETKMSAIDPSSPVVAAVASPSPPAVAAVVESTAVGSNKKAESSRLRRKSLDSATSSAEPLKVLLRLRNLEAKVAQASTGKQIELKLFNGECDETDGGQRSEMMNEVKKMENLLRAKLVVLAKKKETLIKTGQWNNEAKLNLLAEKLAYESVLIGRLHDAVMESRNTDVSDAERLISALDTKISGGKQSLETSLDYLVKSLAKHLTQQGVKRINRKPKDRKKPDPIVSELLNKKNALDSKVDKYIEEVVDKLAQAFAIESLADDAGSERSNDKIQAAWSMAQEAVNQELIQAEISQVLQQCSQNYRGLVETETQSRFTGIVKDRANLEMWSSLADEYLTRDMDISAKRLQDQYSKRLDDLKTRSDVPPKPSEADEERTRALLSQFVDVIAHRALLDARLAVLTNGDYCDNSDIDSAAPFEESSLLSEIQFLYVKFCRDLTQDANDEDRLRDVVDRMAKEVYCLARILNVDDGGETKPENGEKWIESLLKKCENLREKLISMQKTAEDKKECCSCALLQQEISKLETRHKHEINELKHKHELEMSQVKAEFEEQKMSMVEHYKSEEEKLVEKNRQLENQLNRLDEDYTNQTEDLRNAYSATLSLSSCDLEEEENMRQRYQSEIQHLRAVCEKGLVGMENSHRRQIAELQEKHDKELEALRIEKEQALAEETHATLAALDAMRKAHEAEVQKEVAKFKAEYISKLQTNCDLAALHKQHQAEMEEIKREILSLSDKYSIKCVESASLEDKLRVANQQLAHAHQHIMQLDARNRQLRAHIVSEPSNTDAISRLHEHAHGLGMPMISQPRVVNFIPKKSSVVTAGSETHAKSSLSHSIKLSEPSSNPSKTEINKRCSEGVSLCGMVSKRREEFERMLTLPTGVVSPRSRATLI